VNFNPSSIPVPNVPNAPVKTRKNWPIQDELKMKHRGETVIIMGNGPSIKDYDLSDPFFKDNVTIGVNAIGNLFSPTYYLIADTVAWQKFKALVKNSYLLMGCMTPGAEREVQNRRKQGKGASVVYYNNDVSRGCAGSPKIGTIYHGRTGGMVALHTAFQMGFRKYFLLGIDGYGIKGDPHYYKVNSAGRPSDTKLADDRVRANLELFRPAIEKLGGRIWTLSQDTVFDCIPFWEADDDPDDDPEPSEDEADSTVEEADDDPDPTGSASFSDET
jgi:hypothetical protein